MRLRLLLIVPIVVMAASGCASPDQGSGSTGQESPAPSLAASPLTSAAPAPSGSGPQGADTPAVQAAVADLATRLGVTADAVAVTSVQNVTWSDASLGCPQPGMSYIQQLTDGQLVTLTVDGTTYEYHGGGGRALFLCEDPRPPARVD